MLCFLCLIILKLSIYLSYDIIPLKHFEKKTVHYTLTQTFFIFSYNHILSPNSTYSSFTILSTQLNSGYFYVYIYKNASDIKQNFDGNFINYYKTCHLINDYYCFPDDEYISSGTYYFAIQTYNKRESLATFVLYSSGIPYNIQNTFFSTFHYRAKVLEYIFLPINSAKHMRLGYDKNTGSGSFELTIYV